MKVVWLLAPERHASQVTYFEDEGAAYCTDALHHHVKDPLQQADVAGDEHAASDGWVDVTSTYMADCLETRNHSLNSRIEVIPISKVFKYNDR